MRCAYHELQMSCRKRESLEWSAKAKMEADMGKLRENNNKLRGEKYFSLKATFFTSVLGTICESVRSNRQVAN